MKQHITKTDLDMLTDTGRGRLREWWDKLITEDYVSSPIITIENFAYPKLSIGQLIQFLGDKYMQSIIRYAGDNEFDGIYWGEDGKFPKPSELIDALWKAAVDILNKE